MVHIGCMHVFHFCKIMKCCVCLCVFYFAVICLKQSEVEVFRLGKKSLKWKYLVM